MQLSTIYSDILEDIAARLGIPKCNAVAQMRQQENGARLVSSKDGRVLTIGLHTPKSGYIRFASEVGTERARGCNTLKYSANFTAILWEGAGDVFALMDRVNYALAGYKGRGLPYNSIALTLDGYNTVYEQIVDGELGTAQTIPTQAGLAVIRADFSLSFIAAVCDFTAPICRVFDEPVPPMPPALQLFFDNTGITDATLRSQIMAYYETIAARSYFAKLAAVYPFVGGNANAHKFNLLDAQDTDAAFRLGFLGGWTHTANGVTPNGLNAYARTYYVDSVENGVNSNNFGFYSRTNTASVPQCDIGAFDGANGISIFPRTTIVNTNRLYLINGSTGNAPVEGQTQTIRMYQNNRVSPAQVRARIAGALVITPETYINRCTREFYLSALNNVGTPSFYSARALAFAFIARQGFTDAEMADFESDTTTFLTNLGRTV